MRAQHKKIVLYYTEYYNKMRAIEFGSRVLECLRLAIITKMQTQRIV